MTTDLRIYQHHALTFDRGDEVTIRVDGRPLKAFTKEPIAVALFAAGRFLISRSAKFHRPRGAFCLAGNCASCRMEVDGVPNVRTCRTFPRDGMVVRSQGGFPSVTNDLLFAADFVFRKGLDYHSMMTRPPFLNRWMTGAVRRLASSGRLPEPGTDKLPIVHRTCDVAVIGAGPAGVAAALAASGGGRSVVLIDKEPAVGGRLVYEVEDVDLPGEDGPAPGYRFAQNFPRILEEAGVEVVTGEVVARFAEGFWFVAADAESIALRANKTVICAGALDQNHPFPGNDFPKVMSARAARRLTNVHGICPAVQAFIVGTDHDALSLALRLPEIGIRVIGMLEPGDQVAGDMATAYEVQRLGVPIFIGYRLRRATGRFHLTGVELEPLVQGERLKLRCDLLAVSGHRAPAYQLFDQAGAEIFFDPKARGFVPRIDDHGRTSVSDVFGAGEAAGASDFESIVVSGRVAGLTVALDLSGGDGLRERRDALLG